MRSLDGLCWHGLTFIADAMHGDNPAVLCEKPEDSRIEFADVAQLE
jgi:hypothetical protein